MKMRPETQTGLLLKFVTAMADELRVTISSFITGAVPRSMKLVGAECRKS